MVSVRVAVIIIVGFGAVSDKGEWSTTDDDGGWLLHDLYVSVVQHFCFFWLSIGKFRFVGLRRMLLCVCMCVGVVVGCGRRR